MWRLFVCMTCSGTVKLAEAGANQTTAANTANDFTLNLSSANGNIFYVKAYDYAMNESTYRVEMEIGEQPGRTGNVPL